MCSSSLSISWDGVKQSKLVFLSIVSLASYLYFAVCKWTSLEFARAVFVHV